MATIPTNTMLEEEALAIHGAEVRGAKGTSKLYQELNRLDRIALCLSGGGIRSASFALGVIQALASHPRSAAGETVAQADASYLSDINYLSTVSGGGYIGSWLSAWTSRVGFTNIWQHLVGRNHQPDVEPPEISWLRENSNYLTPKLGITSADAWTAVALYLRNLFLNWLVLVPLVCIALIALKGFAAATAWFSRLPDNDALPVILVGGIGAIGLVFALRFTCRNRPSRGATDAEHTITQAQSLTYALIPALVAAMALSLCLVSSVTEVQLRGTPAIIWDVVGGVGGNPQWVRDHPQVAIMSIWGLGGAVLYAASWLLAVPRVHDWKDFFSWAISGVVYAALVGAGVFWYLNANDLSDLFFGLDAPSVRVVAVIIFGVPWVFASQLIAEMIFVGLTSYEDGSDADREWLGRSAGWMLAMAITWPVVMYLLFVGSEVAAIVGVALASKLASVGGVSGLITLLAGKSQYSPSTGPAKGLKAMSLNVILGIAAPIFAAVLVIAISALLDKALLGHSLLLGSELMTMTGLPDDDPKMVLIKQARLTDLYWLLAGFVVVVAVGWFASRRINVNRFSLHALYRNRLIRAFLGATGRPRHADRFTNFDLADNMRMHELWPKMDKDGRRPKVDKSNWQPFHVINMALNIVSSKRLAWQERKAESFTASPLHTGTNCKDGYRPSLTYGDKNGLSLGTALAISGAAASPNMGYHSSSGVAFLMALFNVRLGWWLGNPGKEGEATFTHDGPRTAALPFLKETFGLTTDDQPYVYLSDGGHFENLALYEMVRRRCRYIIVSDADCDPEFAFQDLADAVRKIELDLGISIQFSGVAALKMRPLDGTDIGFNVPYHAIGIIDYPTADGGGAQGIILYIKAAYHGVENAGVRGYAKAHPAFPHESTADQWFSESQFESYRSLGFEIMDELLKSISKKVSLPLEPTLKDLMEALLGQATTRIA